MPRIAPHITLTAISLTSRFGPAEAQPHISFADWLLEFG
jgi:hypothetical protein